MRSLRLSQICACQKFLQGWTAVNLKHFYSTRFADFLLDVSGTRTEICEIVFQLQGHKNLEHAPSFSYIFQWNEYFHIQTCITFLPFGICLPSVLLLPTLTNLRNLPCLLLIDFEYHQLIPLRIRAGAKKRHSHYHYYYY